MINVKPIYNILQCQTYKKSSTKMNMLMTQTVLRYHLHSSLFSQVFLRPQSANSPFIIYIIVGLNCISTSCYYYYQLVSSSISEQCVALNICTDARTVANPHILGFSNLIIKVPSVGGWHRDLISPFACRNTKAVQSNGCGGVRSYHSLIQKKFKTPSFLAPTLFDALPADRCVCAYLCPCLYGYLFRWPPY